MSFQNKTYERSVFGSLTVAFTLGPALIFGMIMAWTGWQTYRSLKTELINQINDDVASLTEIYLEGDAQAVKHAISQRLSLSPLNRSGAHYLFKTQTGDVLSGDLENSVLTQIDLTKTTIIPDTRKGRLLARATVFQKSETLIVARDSSVLQKQVKRALIQLLLGLMSLVSLSYILTRYFVRSLRNRIFSMNTTLERVGEGHLDARLRDDPSRDEISYLSGQINRMIERAERLLNLRKRVADQVAHEVRSPLSRLDATLIEASAQLKNPEKVSQARKEIKNCVELLDGLLDISSMDAQQGDRRAFEKTDLTNLLKSIIELFDPMADENNRSLHVTSDQPVFVNIDPAQMGRLISNLLDNAIKYSYENSMILTTIMIEKNKAVLRVSNSGPQISGKTKTDIFTPFFRHPDMSDRQGFGLGLALCRSIATRHEGTLDIEPTPKLTTFKLVLPLA